MLSENEIEFIVETTMNRLDRKLMDGRISQEEYDSECSKLDTWVEKNYSRQRQAA